MAEAIFTVTSSEDPRLEQAPQTFTAAKGASAVSTVSIQAASFSASTVVFSVIPPSPQVVIQKAPQLDVTLTFQLYCLQSDGTGNALTADPTVFNAPVAMNPNGAPFGVWGRDVCVGAAFPLGRLCSTAQAQINNVTTTMQSVPQPDLSHLWEGPKGRSTHGTTTRTPITASWDDAAGTQWALGADAADMQGEGDIGPGGFQLIGYADDQGVPLKYSSVANFYPGGYVGWPTTVTAFVKPPTPNSTWYRYGIPITDPMGQGAVKGIFPIVRMVDSSIIQPWALNYQRSFEETGLFGISAYTLTLQLQPASQARLWQNCTTSGCVLLSGTQGGVPSFYTGSSGDILQNSLGAAAGTGQSKARMWMTYLSPSIQSTLPARSITTLCNFQYFQQTDTQTGAGLTPYRDGSYQPCGVGIINWSSTTFSNVPDLLMISVRPDPRSMKPNESDWQCTFPDSPFTQFTFANQSGLFSGFTSAMHKQMSINNGVRTSLAAFGGSDGTPGGGMVVVNNRATLAGGAPLLIRPGVDFPLPTGVTVGSTGQVQLNFQLQYNFPRAGTYICTVTALSSGYFVTDSGVSRQLLVGLDEATVLSAPKAPDRFMTQRLAGGSLMGMGASHANGAMARLMKAVATAKGSGNAGGACAAGGMAGGSLSGGAMNDNDWDRGAGDGGAGIKRARGGASGWGASLAARLTRPS